MPRDREAKVRIGADSKKLDPDLRKARKKFQRFGKRTSGDLKKSMGGVRSALGGVAGLGLAAGLLASGRSVLAFEKRLVRLRIQAGALPEHMDKLRKSMYALSDRTGESTENILGAVAGYVSMTGSLKGATSAMETFTKTAVASGASIDDIVRTAAGLQKNMNIDPKQFELAMSMLLSAGKAGSVELKDLAQVLGSVAPQFQEFGEAGIKGLGRLTAAFQTISPTFDFRAAEAATGMRALMTAFQKEAEKIKKLLKVDVYIEGTDKLKTYRQIVVDITKSIEKQSKRGRYLGKALGSTEAMRTYAALSKNITLWDELTESSKGARDVAEDYATFQMSSAGKMARSWERVKNTIAKVFTPGRIEKFAQGMEKVAEAAGFIADHLGIAMALLAAAKLGPGLAALIGWGGVGRGVGAGGGAGAGSKVGGVIGVAALGYAAGTAADRLLGLSDAIAGVTGDVVGVTGEKMAKWHAAVKGETRVERLRAHAKDVASLEHQLPESDTGGRRALRGQRGRLLRKARGIEVTREIAPSLAEDTRPTTPWEKGIAEGERQAEARAAAAEKQKEHQAWAKRMEARKMGGEEPDRMGERLFKEVRYQKLKIEIAIDEQGLLKARAKEATDKRRAQQ